MATVKLEEKYSCYDDCCVEGCPKHNATLEFQTVSNAYKFDNGKGTTHYFEQSELGVMIKLLKKLDVRRFDSIRI